MQNLLPYIENFLMIVGAICILGFIAYLFLRKKDSKVLASKVVLGQNLHQSLAQLLEELPNKVKRETVASVFADVFLRLTRIGVFGLLLAIIPIWLLLNQNQILLKQNEKFDIQNERIKTQNNLIEAQRRGALVILMSDIMNQMNQEIQTQKDDPNHIDSLGYSLSEPLIGRIAALSQGFLPYRIYEADTLTEKEYSPERGQLLLALVNSSLSDETLEKVYASTTFRNSYLSHANLEGIDLHKANIDGTNFQYANLRSLDLNSKILRDLDFTGARLIATNLVGTTFFSSNFNKARLDYSNLCFAGLAEVNLSNASLNKVKFSYSILKDSDFSNADIRSTAFNNATFDNIKGLKTTQLNQVKTLYGAKLPDYIDKDNLDSKLFKKPEESPILKKSLCQPHQ